MDNHNSLTLGRYHFSVIDSTNTWAKKNLHLLDPTKITLITATKQLAGRGRYGRQWKSPDTHNIYASLCFTLPAGCRHGGNLAQIMALSALETLENSGFKGKLKWPNDLLLDGKKVGGILCEIENTKEWVWVILGIGLNVNMPLEQLSAIDQPATSLMATSGAPYDVEAIIQDLLKRFSAHLTTLLKEGFTPFADTYRRHLTHRRGDPVHFQEGKQRWKGKFESINDDGSLCLQLETGEKKTFFAGELL